VTKDGKALTIHKRTTLVFVKQGGQWKIVSGHFSPLPHAS
jgi:ketosteroid isomerase-like protein